MNEHYSREALVYNLGTKGFTLTRVNYSEKHNTIPTEKLIIDLLKTSNNERLLEGLAIVIDNSPPNYDNLTKYALNEGLQNQIGYLLNAVHKVLQKHKPEKDLGQLEIAITSLSLEKTQRIEFLSELPIPNGKQSLLRDRQQEEAEWNVAGAPTVQQIERQYITYTYELAKR
jgi:hypothetical protein